MNVKKKLEGIIVNEEVSLNVKSVALLAVSNLFINRSKGKAAPPISRMTKDFALDILQNWKEL